MTTREANKATVRRYIDELNHRNLAILDEGSLMSSVKQFSNYRNAALKATAI